MPSSKDSGCHSHARQLRRPDKTHYDMLERQGRTSASGKEAGGTGGKAKKPTGSYGNPVDFIHVRSGKPDSDYLDSLSVSFFCRSRIFSR